MLYGNVIICTDCLETELVSNVEDNKFKDTIAELEETLREYRQDNLLKDKHLDRVKKELELLIEDATTNEQVLIKQIEQAHGKIKELQKCVLDFELKSNDKDYQTCGTQTIFEPQSTINTINISKPNIPKESNTSNTLKQMEKTFSDEWFEICFGYQPICKNTKELDFSLTQLQMPNKRMACPRSTLTTEEIAESKQNSKPKIDKNKLKSKLLFLSDSYGRGMYNFLNKKLQQQFDILSIFKPNAMLIDITQNISKLISGYNKEDCVIIVAGTNDIEKQAISPFTDAVLTNLMEVCKHTNLHICAIPYRYDKKDYNCKIYNANKLLFNKLKSSKPEENDLMKIDTTSILNRNDYIRQGLHFNKKGKERFSNFVASLLMTGTGITLQNKIKNFESEVGADEIVLHKDELLLNKQLSSSRK